MSEDSTYDKIRKLLRKAEGTQYTHEAEAFFAKAQELMRKYAIEEAELWASEPDRRQKPIIRVVQMDTTEKREHYHYLITYIGLSNRCRVWRVSDSCHIAGFDSDVNFVEMLFHSVVVQMNLAMMFALAFKESSVKPKTFKDSFLRGFTASLWNRLKEEEAKSEDSKALVLVNRKSEVDDFVESLNLRIVGARGYNRHKTESREGMQAGMNAARNVDLSGGRNTLRSPKALG